MEVEFKNLKHERERALAAAEERIREREDSPARVQARQAELTAEEFDRL